MKVFCKLIVIKLLLLMGNTMFGQEMNIMLGKNDFVKVQILDFEQFEKIKNTTSLTRIPTLKRNGVSRTFENEAKEIFIEFYDRTVLQIKNAEDLQRLEKVSFESEKNWKLKIPIMSIAYVDENFFDELKPDAKLIEDVGPLSNIGEFYQLANGFVVMKWVSIYQNVGKYSIIEDIKNANGLDMELFYEGFYEEGELERSQISKDFKRKKIVFDEEFDSQVWEGGKQNLEELTYRLSEYFNIDEADLDFSEKSFDQLEAALWWSYAGSSPYELVNPLAAYLGITLTRNHNEIEWTVSSLSNTVGLESKDGEIPDLVGEVRTYMIDTDYMMPQIKPALQNILQELGIK